jgi:hypothetical protein
MPTDHMHRWENEKRQRYYLAHVHVDLLGDRVISCYWGGKTSRLGGESHQVVGSDGDAQNLLALINRTRLKHGYQRAALHRAPQCRNVSTWIQEASA